MITDLVDGFRYIHHHRVIKGVVVVSMVVGVFGASYETLLPAFADGFSRGGVETYSRLLLAAGIGGLTATAAIAFLGTRVRPGWFFVLSGIGFGIGLVMLSKAGWFPATILIMALMGAARVVFGTMSTTLLQTLADDEFRGRVMSVHEFSWGATALGSLLMGGLAETFSVPVAMGGGGVVILVATAGVTAWLLRQVLGMEREKTSSSVASG